MLRRKLALYTLFYIAGITAGFFIFERFRIAEAAGFCAAVIAAVLFTRPPGHLYLSQRRTEDNSARHADNGKEYLKGQKTILLMLFFAGFLLFAFRSHTYNSGMSCVQDPGQIRGRVTSVSVKDEKIRLIVRNSGKGPARVIVSLDADATGQFIKEVSDKNGTVHARSDTNGTVHARPDTNGCRDSFEEDGAQLRSAACSCIGSAVEARGKFAEIAAADDPGCFDYSLYMKSKGVSAGFKAYIVEIIDTKVSLRTKARLYLYGARESFISRFDAETRGFIRGVIFGDKSDIDDEILDEFNSNSTGHILAVSGLHIGFLYGLLRVMTSRRRTLPVSILIIAVILLYGEMTMWSPATLRACIVMAISLAGTHLRRRSDLITSVSLAAFLILTMQPYQLFSSGFQLSFLALCGIAFLTRPVSTVTGEAAAVMIAVQAGTMPIIAYSYCKVNPLSILVNVPVILLASVLVPLCILLLMLQITVLKVPAAGIDLAELISYAVIKLNHVLSFGGEFSIKTAGPGAAAAIAFYILIFGLASEWARVMLLRKDLKAVLKQGILLMMPLAMLFSCLYDTIADDEIVFVAVGQGDCVHIRADGHNVLIDGGGQTGYDSHNDGNDDKTGGKDSAGYNTGKNILMPYLMHSGADAVDIALVTHLHADHYKGIEELSEVFPVGAIGIPIDYKTSVSDISGEQRSTEEADDGDRQTDTDILSDPSRLYFVSPDTKINISDDVCIDVIWPVEAPREPLAADDPNEHNTVYMIHYRDIKIMVTGDLLEEDEHEMVAYYRDTDTLKCDILKVAHHGSKSSSSVEFLDAASPDIAVIQVGADNFYGHPHKQTLERLEERGIRVFRTDNSGAVGIDIHGTRLSVDLFRQEPSE